ncbi:hypothetical protein [Corynebacterium sp. A21]|uniref:hypothetical protein n=1 Tax=Corynebacterium sp. A21 TaxID=3457318 RepID=UPI003FD2DE66
MSTNFKELAEFFDAGDFSAEAKAAEPMKTAPGSGNAGEPMDAFTVRLPVSVLEAVRKIAAEEGETTGSVIRRMVESAVAEHTSDQAVVPVSALRELISLAENDGQPRERKARKTVVVSTRSRGRAVSRSAATGQFVGKKTGKKRKVS